MPIFLIGYMACGKTTLGKAVAAECSLDFIDLDEYITAQTGMTPREWFSEKGEKAFREIELKALVEICSTADAGAIVATGGGTPANGDAMELMLEKGKVVWLEASLQRTVDRLLEAEGERPIVAGKDASQLLEFIPAHLNERVPFYRRAPWRFDSTYLDTPEEIRQTVSLFKSLFLSNP